MRITLPRLMLGGAAMGGLVLLAGCKDVSDDEKREMDWSEKLDRRWLQADWSAHGTRDSEEGFRLILDPPGWGNTVRVEGRGGHPGTLGGSISFDGHSGVRIENSRRDDDGHWGGKVNRPLSPDLQIIAQEGGEKQPRTGGTGAANEAEPKVFVSNGLIRGHLDAPAASDPHFSTEKTADGWKYTYRRPHNGAPSSFVTSDPISPRQAIALTAAIFQREEYEAQEEAERQRRNDDWMND